MESGLLSYIVFSLTDCMQGELMCDVKRCISLSDRCNGRADCEDQTDEQDCESRFINTNLSLFFMTAYLYSELIFGPN